MELQVELMKAADFWGFLKKIGAGAKLSKLI